jgi:hypothetical protein
MQNPDETNSAAAPPHPAGIDRAPYLSPDALSRSEILMPHADAADHAETIVNRWVRTQGGKEDAADSLSQAARDLAMWLVAHGRHGPLTLTIGWKTPRVLIEFIDQGTATPDLYRSRHDVALAYRILAHCAVKWSCEVDERGHRISRIYGDVTASKTANSEEWL